MFIVFLTDTKAFTCVIPDSKEFYLSNFFTNFTCLLFNIEKYLKSPNDEKLYLYFLNLGTWIHFYHLQIGARHLQHDVYLVFRHEYKLGRKLVR